MKIIMCLTDLIEEELHDADKYIDLAMKYKDEDEDVSKLFAELSAEEIGHAEKLHAEVVDQIRVYREDNGDPPKGMKELYDHIHQKHTEEAMKIKIKQNMLKE